VDGTSTKIKNNGISLVVDDKSLQQQQKYYLFDSGLKPKKDSSFTSSS